MGRSLRYFSQRTNPINICGNRILMFRTKSFAKIAAVFLYSSSLGQTKKKARGKNYLLLALTGVVYSIYLYMDSNCLLSYNYSDTQ